MTEATVRQLHTNLMNSPGHYANIVNGLGRGDRDRAEAGTINGYKVVFVTQNFGTPNAAEAEPNDVGTTTPTTPDRAVHRRQQLERHAERHGRQRHHQRQWRS